MKLAADPELNCTRVVGSGELNHSGEWMYINGRMGKSIHHGSRKMDGTCL